MLTAIRRPSGEMRGEAYGRCTSERGTAMPFLSTYTNVRRRSVVSDPGTYAIVPVVETANCALEIGPYVDICGLLERRTRGPLNSRCETSKGTANNEPPCSYTRWPVET